MAKRNTVGAKGARLLRKVAKHILEEPARYEQNVWLRLGVPGKVTNLEHIDNAPTEFPACGTIACLGGWVNQLTSVRSRDDDTFRRACGQIGVDSEMGANLFGYNTGWPEPYMTAYENATTLRGKAKVAARRIEHFIKTGK